MKTTPFVLAAWLASTAMAASLLKERENVCQTGTASPCVADCEAALDLLHNGTCYSTSKDAVSGCRTHATSGDCSVVLCGPEGEREAISGKAIKKYGASLIQDCEEDGLVGGYYYIYPTNAKCGFDGGFIDLKFVKA